jgi:hypothetical protein
MLERAGKRQKSVPGKSGVKYAPLVYHRLLLLSSLYINLGTMKHFVKTLDSHSDHLNYLKR